MATATVGVAILPIVPIAIVLAASDRGLNYSLQQVTKESLYVPLSDAHKYKAKAFIDMFVNRAGKALSSVALLAIVAAAGVSIRACAALALGALALWAAASVSLGRSYSERFGSDGRAPAEGGRRSPTSARHGSVPAAGVAAPPVSRAPTPSSVRSTASRGP